MLKINREILVFLYLSFSSWIPFSTGCYAKRPFLRPVKALGLVVFSRLRKDADLRNVPSTKRRQGQRGPLPTYGKEGIDLAKRAAQKRGWQQVACVQYGERVVKTIKTFEATWRPAGGRIRVVIVWADEGGLAYFCTDPAMLVVAILEAMADRGVIEQSIRDPTSTPFSRASTSAPPASLA